jgi:plastocyanin
MRSSKPLHAVAALVISAGLLAACGNSTHSSTDPSSTSTVPHSPDAGLTGTTITIKNFAFTPATLTVAAGATVTVHNTDSATHTVSAVDAHTGMFNTGDVAPGGTVTFTAPATPGTYAYICMIHQFMHGTLDVR